MKYFTSLQSTQIFSLCFTIALWGVSVNAAPVSKISGYSQPPKEILDAMRAASLPSPLVSPTRDKILLVTVENYPSIERVALPFLRLAGARVEPGNHSKHDTRGGYGIPSCAKSFTLVNVADGGQKSISLKQLKCPDTPTWNANGRYFVFIDRNSTAVELWVGDAKTARLKKIKGVKLNPMFEEEVSWMPDQKSVLIKMLPAKLGSPPKAGTTLIGPSIQETNGEKGLSSTYEKRDTLNNKYDEALFDYYGTSQLARVDVTTGKISLLGSPGLYLSVDPAPDGQHVLISKIVRPYSYLTTYERFPREVAVWNLDSRKKVTQISIAKLPLADRVPIHGVPTGPRSFGWRATDPATLIWAEALDQGDWGVKVPHRDKIMLSKAPFKNPVEIFQTEQRFGGFDWFEQSDLALLSEYNEDTHWEKTFIVNIDDPKQTPRLLWDLSWDEKYANPGSPVHNRLPNGTWVIRKENNSIYLSGRGASPLGDRPFLDRLNLETLKTERLFRSDKEAYEYFLGFPTSQAKTFLTWYQTPVDAPNVYIRELGTAINQTPPAGEALYSSTSKALTHIPDPTPEVRKIKKRLIKYKRADGLDLSFTLYTPPDYKEGTRVPAILYAYPLDYADPSKAGQVTGSQSTFTQLYDYRFLLLAGYAIIDRTSFPIVGDPKKAYDTYLEQLVADAKAAVDEAVRLGVVDSKRIGVTGHSHGALMVANLVTHSDLFKAGVATSGSYNKTLTPFGFQNERRTLWEAPEVYRKVSTLFSVDKLKTPLLIMHGAEDANPGTTPMQASFLYEAIRGNGGTARLVMLPHEPHWYTARESNEQEIYEMLTWFDKYVKGAEK
jgi:dipeptidyl aminopeptidase/acylaminoacyl peptidase